MVLDGLKMIIDWLCHLIGFLFFFQAEDGIRDTSVTGVQTCALPIFGSLDGVTESPESPLHRLSKSLIVGDGRLQLRVPVDQPFAAEDQTIAEHLEKGVPHGAGAHLRSEERRVGKEGRSRWSPVH